MWLFGQNAGLNFDSGNPVSFSGSQLNTVEGCSSIADENGALLFYTDGITVWNSQHQQMTNGVNLGGNPSSSQSGLIVPNPNDPTIYYLFTVGTNAVGSTGLPQNAGFKYYTVDMSLNGGLGDVVAGSVVNLSGGLSNSWTEKVTAVKTDNCDSYWAISLVNNTFYSYLVDGSGVAVTPVISTVSNSAGDVRGYLKIAPDGTKIVSANMNTGTYIYDFDNATGIISNGNQLNINGERGYGVEFSLNSKRLYISTGNFTAGSTENLYQFDLDLTTFNDVNNSRRLIHSYSNTRGALQLASNGKIYWASDGSNDNNKFISVINAPENLGSSVNYQHRSVSLGGRTCTQGLPPFIQSLFLPSVDIINNNPLQLATDLDLCDGDTFRLESNDVGTYPPTTTYEWTFNDNPIVPNVTTSYIDIDGITHGDGEYRVKIDFNDNTCQLLGVATITYHANPTINTPVSIKQCDDDTDGISLIDLTLFNDSISTDSAVQFSYFTDETDANNDTGAILDPVNYSTATNTLWVRVTNIDNCFKVARLDILVSATATAYNKTISKCDDFVDTSNNDYDGFSEFDLTQVETDVLNLFPASIQADLGIAYYKNINDAQLQANAINNPATYRNSIIFNERIYIRVNNNTNLDCAGLGIDLYIDLVVEPLPVVTEPTPKRGCDNGSGQFDFNTTGIINEVLGTQTGITLTFFDENDVQIPTASFFPNYTSTSQTIKIVATNNITNDVNGPCSKETTQEFIVDFIPIANTIPILQLCDDAPDGNDGMSVFDTSLIESAILGGSPADTEIHYYTNYYDLLLRTEILPTLPEFFNTATQTITAEVINTNNPNCVATTDIQFLIEEDSPIFDIYDQLLCLDQLPTPLMVSIENPMAIYTYYWENDKGEQVGDDTATIGITEAGEYTVTATSTSICDTTKTFTITESSIPQIETVTIFDDSPNNRVSVLVSGAGDYEFSLDNEAYVDGNELYGHIFYNVLEGAHTININDKNGCTPVVTKEIVVVRFPRHISPNHDGIYDTFSIYGGDAFAETNVVIYDRYGKTIANLKNNDSWDGLYLGKIASEADYWFVATFTDNLGKEYERKGHFSLKH